MVPKQPRLNRDRVPTSEAIRLKPTATDTETDSIDLLDYNYSQPGSLPGTLNIPEDAQPTELSLISYDTEQTVSRRLQDPEECLPYLERDMVCWLDVGGLGTESVLRKLGAIFNLHPLVLEDVVNVPQRAKLDLYEDHLLMIVHMVRPAPKGNGFAAEQIGFILRHHVLLTLQEEGSWDCFDSVRNRIQRNLGKVRQQGAGFLAYTLLDTIVDGYFPVLEDYGEYIDTLEDEVVMRPTRKTLARIHDLRRELLMLRRYIWPQRTVVNNSDSRWRGHSQCRESYLSAGLLRPHCPDSRHSGNLS